MNVFMHLALALAWLAILLGGWLGWQLLRQNGRVLLRLDELEKRLNALEFGDKGEPEGLPLNSSAPDFDLPDLFGQRHRLAEYDGGSVLLIFFNPACGYCLELASRLATQVQNTSQSQIVIVSTGGVEPNQQFFSQQKLTCPVLLQKEMEVASTYRANGTPSGYLISHDGKIASQLTIGVDILLALVQSSNSQPDVQDSEAAPSNNGEQRETRFRNRSLARSKIKRDGLKVGTVAPDFRLPRLDGRGELRLQDLRGRRVLLVFSSPSCGPCNTLAPQLETFHREHPEPELLMISQGEPKENRAKVREHGLTFPIVLQHQWEISRQYAMFATPIAYLIDEQGIIARDVAVGTDAIMRLLVRRLEGQLPEVPKLQNA